MRTENTYFPLLSHSLLRMMASGIASGILALLFVGISTAEERVLCDFEDSASLRLWEKGDHIELSDTHATRGKRCAKITLDKAVVAGSWTRLPGNWSKYDQLRLDFFNPGEPVVLAVRIKDGNGKGYNLWSYNVPKGEHKAVFDLAKVGAKIDLSNIKQFWFHTTGKSTPPRVLYLDNVRLTGQASSATAPTAAAKPIPIAKPIPWLRPGTVPASPARRTPTLKPGKGATFRNIGIGGGGYMHSPSFSPYDKSLMQTSCDMGGRYISSDGGRRWHIIPFWEIAGHTGKAAFDKQHIYIRGGGAINVSADKGVTWKVVKTLPWSEKEKATVLKTVGAGGTRVAVGTDAGLWLSADRGRTWKRSYAGKVFDLAGLKDVLFLSGDKKLKVSGNLGASWSDITPKSGGQIISLTCGQDVSGMLLLALLDDKNTLLRSRDWGKTWTKTAVGGTPARSATMVEMAANQTRVVFINRSGELWRSVDSGKTWTRSIYARGGVAPGVRDSEFCGRHKWGIGRVNFGVDATDTRRVIVTSMSDLFLSNDAGATWTQMYNDDVGRLDKGSKDFFCRTRGLTMTSAWQFHIDPRDRKYQYICYTDFGFLRSIDGGTSWASSPPANSCYAMQFDPTSIRIYGAASQVHDIPGWGFTHNKAYKGGRVVYSDDRGDNWHTLGKGFPDIPCTFLELDRFRSKNGKLVFWATFYGNHGGGLYRSDDSGMNWRRVKGLGYPSNDHFLEVRVHPKTGEIYVSVSGTRKLNTMNFETGGFWHSNDDGKTWTNIAKSLDLRWQERFCIVPDEPGTVYLAASTPPRFRQGGVYKTTNNGKSWKQVLDVGTTKQVPYTSSGILQVLSVDVHPTNPNIIYACTKTHGLWCSQDKGETWKFMKVPHFRVSHVTVDPDDPESIYVTTFGGGTWVGHYLP